MSLMVYHVSGAGLVGSAENGREKTGRGRGKRHRLPAPHPSPVCHLAVLHADPKLSYTLSKMLHIMIKAGVKFEVILKGNC